MVNSSLVLARKGGRSAVLGPPAVGHAAHVQRCHSRASGLGITRGRPWGLWRRSWAVWRLDVTTAPLPDGDGGRRDGRRRHRLV